MEIPPANRSLSNTTISVWLNLGKFSRVLQQLFPKTQTQLISFRKSASLPHKQVLLLDVESPWRQDESRYMKAAAWLITRLSAFPLWQCSSSRFRFRKHPFLQTSNTCSCYQCKKLLRNRYNNSCDHRHNYITRNWWMLCPRSWQICMDLYNLRFGKSHSSQ